MASGALWCGASSSVAVRSAVLGLVWLGVVWCGAEQCVMWCGVLRFERCARFAVWSGVVFS